ncbi:MAG TPA: hypothetical protein VGL40_14925 [Bacillota bacterium]|jgi:hypothetical protein
MRVDQEVPSSPHLARGGTGIVLTPFLEGMRAAGVPIDDVLAALGKDGGDGAAGGDPARRGEEDGDPQVEVR